MPELPVDASRIVGRLSTGDLDDLIPVQVIDLLGAGGIVWNEAGLANDFRIKSLNNPNMLFLDGANDRVGFGALAPTDGTVHIASGSAGTVIAQVNFDELVLEGSGNVGLTFVHNDTDNTHGIQWSTPTQATRCAIIHDPTNNEAQLRYSNLPLLSWNNNAGIVINQNLVSTVDFRVGSDLNAHMLFVDAGNNSVHIDNNLLTGAGDGDLVMANDKFIHWINAAGTSSTNSGIKLDANNDMDLFVPGSGDKFNFITNGANIFSLAEENAGMGLLFNGESSSDHSAPGANNCVLFIADNGGKTELRARFNTGAVQVVAAEP